MLKPKDLQLSRVTKIGKHDSASSELSQIFDEWVASLPESQIPNKRVLSQCFLQDFKAWGCHIWDKNASFQWKETSVSLIKGKFDLAYTVI